MIITAFVIDIAWEHQTTDPALARLLFELSNSLALGEGGGHSRQPIQSRASSLQSPVHQYYHSLTWLYQLLIGRARRLNLDSID